MARTVNKQVKFPTDLYDQLTELTEVSERTFDGCVTRILAAGIDSYCEDEGIDLDEWRALAEADAAAATESDVFDPNG